MTERQYIEFLYSDSPIEAKMLLWFVLFMDDCPVKKDIVLRGCKLWVMVYKKEFEYLIEKKLNIIYKL